MQYLHLTLSGVLQSYGGVDSNWVEVRNTEMHPTASTVAGLLACALGIKKGTEAYDWLLTLDYRTSHLPMARILDDYQMVYPKEPKKLSKESKMRKINGAVHSSQTGQRPIHKMYLADAVFHVYVGCEDVSRLREIHAALRNPKWVYYLGRACCTPSREIVPAEFRTCAPEMLSEVYPCI